MSSSIQITNRCFKNLGFMKEFQTTMPRLLWVAGIVTAVIAWVGPTAFLLFLLKSTFHLLAWLDGVEKGNVASGFMDGNWSPVQKEIDRAACKVLPLFHIHILIEWQ